MARPAFPKTLREFQLQFADEASCRAYLTDGWKGYLALSRMGYRHRPKTQGEPKRFEVILPRASIMSSAI